MLNCSQATLAVPLSHYFQKTPRHNPNQTPRHPGVHHRRAELPVYLCQTHHAESASYEPSASPGDEQHIRIFAILGTRGRFRAPKILTTFFHFWWKIETKRCVMRKLFLSSLLMTLALSPMVWA